MVHCSPLLLGLSSMVGVIANPLPEQHGLLRTNDWSCEGAHHANPVVLLHGLGGSEQIGLRSLETWLRVRGLCTFALTYGSYAPQLSILGGLKPIAESSQEIAAFVGEVHRRTGARKVDLVGHSEGAFQALYTPKFGGVADVVDNVVAIAPPTHGTSFAGLYNLAYVLGHASREAVGALLHVVGCAACDDLGPEGAAVTRLNDGKPIVQPGNTVTVIASGLDELITPTTTAFINEPGVNNVYVQDYCPLDPVGHMGEAVDANVWNLVLNTLEKKVGRGPRRVPSQTELCLDVMDTDTSDIELTAQCLCKAQTFAARVPRASLPLTATFCHCTSCRHLTGGMHSTGVAWPGAADAIVKAQLAKYVSSPKLTLLFCGTCSSPMFWRERLEGGADAYEAFTGVLSNNPVPGLIRFKDHIFVHDTLDGGVAVWQRHLNKGDDAGDAPIPCYGGWRHKSEELDPATLSVKDANTAMDGTALHCRCKGVNLVLRRGAADFAAMDPAELPFFVEPGTHKLLAGFDACNSCRKMSGVDVVNWAFSLLQHIDYPSGDGSFPRTTPALKAAVGNVDRDPGLGTLAMYASSADVQRYFCSRCSASVFYAVDSRPDMVDLAVGLLDAPDGARAESVLAWALGMMVWADDVKGGWREELVDAMKRNSEAWRVDRGIPMNWAVIVREQMDAMAKAAAKS
ncbi:Uncharacterized protein TCAP_03180 [Tolypocladium capitatum]|uniref:CENP-V/GFA domain-containing protein n=1 Tax=Tolypocladium capitatum TaxID=45235 RepID=A0A2K3QH64_9HYPO|nr:Uncharacterized protein TCAP_03180 [Tolypocladium capitatum]